MINLQNPIEATIAIQLRLVINKIITAHLIYFDNFEYIVVMDDPEKMQSTTPSFSQQNRECDSENFAIKMMS